MSRARLQLPGIAGTAAVVTGAGGGFGRAVAISLLQLGCRGVVLCDIDAARLAETAKLCREGRPDPSAVVEFPVDVSKAEDNDAAVAACVKAYGACDIFFANAGIVGTRESPNEPGLVGCSLEGWRRTMGINVDGVFYGYRAAAKQMLKQGRGGSIIGTASVAGLQAGAGPVDYSVSKAAVVQLTKAAALSLEGTGIRVNCVCPGLIATNLTLGLMESQGYLASDATKEVADDLLWKRFRNPMGRYGKISEVSNVVLFLASSLASFVNGQAIAVDGGQSSVYSVDDPVAPSFTEGNDEYVVGSR